MRVSITIDDFIYGLLKEQAMKRDMPVNNIIRRAIYKELHDLANQNRMDGLLMAQRNANKPKDPLESITDKSPKESPLAKQFKVKARFIPPKNVKSPAELIQEALDDIRERLPDEMTVMEDAKGKLTVGFRNDKPNK